MPKIYENKTMPEDCTNISTDAVDAIIAAAEKSAKKAKSLKKMFKTIVKNSAGQAGIPDVRFALSYGSALKIMATPDDGKTEAEFNGEDEAYTYKIAIQHEENGRGRFATTELTRTDKETGQAEKFHFDDGGGVWGPEETSCMRPEDCLLEGYMEAYGNDISVAKLQEIQEKNARLLELAYALDEGLQGGTWFSFTDGDNASLMASPEYSGLCVQYYGGEYHARLYMGLLEGEQPFGDAYHTPDVGEMAGWLTKIYTDEYEDGLEAIVPLSHDAILVIIHPEEWCEQAYIINYTGKEEPTAEEQAMAEEAHRRIAEYANALLDGMGG